LWVYFHVYVCSFTPFAGSTIHLPTYSILDFQLRSPIYFTLARNPLKPGLPLQQPPLERIECGQQSCVLTGLVRMRLASDKGSHSVIRRRLVIEFV